MKVWREARGLDQKEAAEVLGLASSSYQNYELGTRGPRSDAMEKFANGGINLNWLVTGHGPMLLADLEAMARPAPMKINRGALAALLRGAIAITAQGMSVEKAADMAAEMYERALLSGEITPDGVGDGSLGNAA